MKKPPLMIYAPAAYADRIEVHRHIVQLYVIIQQNRPSGQPFEFRIKRNAADHKNGRVI